MLRIHKYAEPILEGISLFSQVQELIDRGTAGLANETENPVLPLARMKVTETSLYIVAMVVFDCGASIAQWLEHWSCKPGVGSSILPGG